MDLGRLDPRKKENWGLKRNLGLWVVLGAFILFIVVRLLYKFLVE